MKVIQGSTLGMLAGMLAMLLSASLGGSSRAEVVPFFGIVGALTGLAFEIRGAADRIISSIHQSDLDMEEEEDAIQ